ncbi:MAG TPA: MCE family protein [Jatrophihabitans sp.]|jgi:virulence factor Mce-like protein|uniref:MCE family protein n=1 Tax=Jatrophihabitans sp. TaxID=1932789 RepID=UPI002E04EE89|nr:MCE family protein [Jatrophihabitans sp.]
MPKESVGAVVKRRLLGLTFIALVAGLVSLSIAIYNKAFTDTVDVTLKADHTGNQLILDSDVKERGIIVGSVTAVRANGADAIVTLALEPGRVKDIPKNVTAQILPKTLFGEQYVALSIPSNPEGPIAQGDIIPQDRSQGALEAQDVLGDFLPLLTAVQPAELNDTLTALATALNNRGPKLGQTLVNFDKYLKVINPHTTKLVDDLKKLGEVALEYNGLAPDLLASLQNLQTSARTIIDRRAALDNLLTTGSNSALLIRDFLSENQSRLIAVTGQSDKIYGLLAQYSPEYSCLLTGINKLVTLANQAIYDHAIHLSATADTSNPGAYKPGQQPRIVTGLGPNCFGLPDNPQPIVGGKFQIPDKYKCVNDGAPLTSDPCGKNPSTASTRSLNTTAENVLVNSLIAGDLNTTPNKVPGGATLLAAPLLRGQEVQVK